MYLTEFFFHFFIINYGKKIFLDYIKLNVTVYATPWCNGSTSGFGPLSSSSNLDEVAIFVFRRTRKCLEFNGDRAIFGEGRFFDVGAADFPPFF